MSAQPVFRMSDTEVYFGDTLLQGVSPNGFACLVSDSYGMYARDEQGVWYFHQYGAKHHTRFVTANAHSFRVLGRGYGSDTNSIFYAGRPIKSAQVGSFRVICNNFAADDGAVYIDSIMAEGFQIWTDVDAASLQFFDEDGPTSSYFADRFHLYYFNHHFTQYAFPHHPMYRKKKLALQQRLPDAKAWWNLPDGFQDKLTPIGQNYFTNGDFVFYRFKKSLRACCQYDHTRSDEDFLILPDADSRTFKELNDFYGSDENGVYCLSRKFAADPKTFQVREGEFGEDKTGIWFNGFHVPEISASDLKVLSNKKSTFAFDRDNLFCAKPLARIGKGKGYARLLKLAKNGDPATFELLSIAFSKDKNQVYWYDEVWKAADPDTFEVVLDNNYSEFARDCKHLYRAVGKTVFKNIDGTSFQLLNQYWAKDKKSIIYMGGNGKVMRGADVGSFEVLDGEGSAQDARKRYWIEHGTLRSKRR